MNYHLASKFLYIILIYSTLVEAKITIFAHYFGQPEFIKYQYAFFKKNILDEYEFIVVEDSDNLIISYKIKRECERLGIQYIRIPRSAFIHPKLPVLDDSGGPSFECSVAVQYIYDNYIVPSKDICLIMDNDIFLVSPFNIEEYLGSHSFAYVSQEKEFIDYMLPNFLIVNPSKMPEKEKLNFNLGVIQGVRTDSGGFTHFYLKEFKKLGKAIPVYHLFTTPSPLKEKFINVCPLLFTSKAWGSHYFIDPELFLHIRMGSNWAKHRDYPKMMKEVTFFMNQLLFDKYYKKR